MSGAGVASRKDRRAQQAKAAQIYGIKGPESLQLHEAYNALVCNELAPEVGRHAVFQLGDTSDDNPRALPPTLRGRTLFASGLGVEEIARREREGWDFRKTRLTDKYTLEDARADLPPDADLLVLVRDGGEGAFAAAPIARDMAIELSKLFVLHLAHRPCPDRLH